MGSLYSWLGIPVSPAMLQEIHRHFHAEEAGKARDEDIYSTYRTSNYSPPATLPGSVSRELERHCAGVIQLGKYP